MISGSFIVSEDDNGVLPHRVAARKINEATDMKLLKTSTVRGGIEGNQNIREERDSRSGEKTPRGANAVQ